MVARWLVLFHHNGPREGLPQQPTPLTCFTASLTLVDTVVLLHPHHLHHNEFSDLTLVSLSHILLSPQSIHNPLYQFLILPVTSHEGRFPSYNQVASSAKSWEMGRRQSPSLNIDSVEKDMTPGKN